MPSVGAIIPSFNRRTMVGSCVLSLLRQSRVPNRIMVIDDGSTDATGAYLRDRFGDRVEIIRKDNGGKSSALNLGISRLDTDFVWICDDDDLAAPHACRVLAERLEQASSEVGFVHGHYRVFAEHGRGLKLSPPPVWARADEPDMFINLLEDLYIYQFSTMFKRSLLQEVGGFREDLLRSQDFDMMIRIARKTSGIYIPETIFYQRSHAGARGPAEDRVLGSESFRRWLHYDQKFFAEMAKDRLSLTPTFALRLPMAARRRVEALQRAVVFGRRGLWDVALDALELAADGAPGSATLPEEKRLAMLLLRYGLPSAALPNTQDQCRRVVRLKRRSANGAALSAAIADAATGRLYVAMTERRLKDAVADAAFLWSVGSLTWLLGKAFRKIRGKFSTTSLNQEPTAVATVSARDRSDLVALLEASRRSLL